MAGDPMPVGTLLERRRLALAARKLRNGAPGVKMTAGWWVDGTGNFARQSDAPPFHFWVGNRDRRQQRFSVGVQRRGIKLAGWRGFDDAPEIHDGNALADMLDDRQIVGNKEISEPEFLLQVIQQIDDLGLDRHIQCRHRLIADNQFRLDGERARDTDALALTAGELVRITSHVIRLQTDGLEQMHDALFKLASGFRQLVNDQGFANDGADVHARIERCIGVLKDNLDVAAQDAKLAGVQRPDILAFEMYLAPGRFDQAKHATPGGRLTTAGFANQPQGFAALDVKVDTVDRMDAAGLTAEQAALEREYLGQVPDSEQRLTH